MGKDKIDTFNLGLCNKCLEIVERQENSDETCICACGESMDFHIAHLLLMEAIYQGRNDVLRRVVESLPKAFLMSHGNAEIEKEDLLGLMEIKGVRKKLSVFRAVVAEGTDIVNELILARQIDIKEKYGREISRADAAAILAFKNIMRTYEADEGDLTQNVAVQDLNELAKNEAGEFALSFLDGNKRWIKANVEYSNSLSACQPEINIRYKNEGECVHAYIKSILDTFVVIYRSTNFPRGSKVFIFYHGAIAG